MAERITKNNFSRGRNTDIDKNALEPVYFTDAHNVELTSDGNFLALKNLKGTVEVEGITNVAGTEVLGIFETFYKIDTASNVKCLTIFTATNSLLKIWCYDTESDVKYELYEEVVSNYLTSDRIINADAYGENELDILYFTDNKSELRQLRCEIPSGFVANSLTEYDLSLQRWGANGQVTIGTVTTGGSLISGSYQFAYRMVDHERKRFTKWSSLTFPVSVTLAGDISGVRNSGIGLYTDQMIVLTVNPSQAELDIFSNKYFQLAVVENIFPTGAEVSGSGDNQVFVASLQPITPVASLSSYEYKTNSKVDIVPISEIVVDLAAIDTAKTLKITGNRLFTGNVKYKELDFDNGTPEIGGGSIYVANSGSIAASDLQPGYMRGEVYRFAIVYEDKYGNKSEPKVLDLSGVTGNEIELGLTDMKFPTRVKTGGTYSLLDSSHNRKYLWLQLNDIVNHPTWAVAFEIVRVKRIPRILFQTPLIPMMYVEGTGSFRNYPSKITVDAAGTTEDLPNAQPMTNSKVYMPKNLLRPELRNIEQNQVDIPPSKIKGECRLSSRPSTYDLAAIFPPSVFGVDYIPSGNESIELIDFVALRVTGTEYSTVVDDGDNIDTSVSFTLHGLRNGDYYFDSTHFKPPLTETSRIVDYQFFDNLSSGGVVGGEKVLQYDELETEGLTWGIKPSVQKMAVIKLASPANEEFAFGRNFANGNQSSYSAGGEIFMGGGISFEAAPTNKILTQYTGFTTSKLVQVVKIVNIVNSSIGDSRYGNTDTQYEFISTGARYTFTPTELADVQAAIPVEIDILVAGGDSFVGDTTFKVCDSTYSVTNQQKYTGLPTISLTQAIDKWNKVYRASTTGTYSLPVPLKNVGQYLQVVLENTYNTQVMDLDVLGSVDTAYGSKAVLGPISEASIRTPLTYRYNFNLSKQNDQKVYVSLPAINFRQNVFKARVNYSDIKLYNSSEQGFDVFRVLNFVDLEEAMGGITKLALAGDDLYAIQERGVTYLPIGQTQLETTDADTIAVGTSDVVGRLLVLDTNRGGQHLGAIVETGDVVYVPDVRNKAVYALAGRQLVPIMGYNNTLFRDKFSDTIVERNLIGIYDPVRKQYWLADNDEHWCEIFDENLKNWVGNYEFSVNNKLYGGVYANQNLYLLGEVSDQLSVHTMYTGDLNQLFGVPVTPRVSFVVNPDADISKTFDVLMFSATDRLDEVDLTVEREQALGNQTVTGTNIATNYVEGNYRIKTLRDGDGARLRGLRMLVTVKWGELLSVLSNVYTKFRHSNRIPF